MSKSKLSMFLENIENDKSGSILPSDLSSELKDEAMNIAKGETEDMSDELYDALFNSQFAADMPYGTAKARTGDPIKWLIEKLRRTYGKEKN